MPAYKDSKTGTWFVKFYCKDWTGAVSYTHLDVYKRQTEYEAEGTKITMSCLLKDLKKYKEYVIL